MPQINEMSWSLMFLFFITIFIIFLLTTQFHPFFSFPILKSKKFFNFKKLI